VARRLAHRPERSAPELFLAISIIASPRIYSKTTLTHDSRWARVGKRLDQ
jgi:hypothetical protein